MGNAVELNNLVKRYGAFTAVHPVSLEIPEGEFVTLLGPSGCGKTTTLRMIAGLESITEGSVKIKGNEVNNLPVHKRNLGIVFQNYALFPHKTVYDNVAFGLKYRNFDKSQIKEKVNLALERVRLPQMAERFPSQLSGGQQQRIALARAIVIEPDVLLLDEPLSALDANLRENMRVELKNIQEDLGVTSIFVTHDQSEALAMSDKVVIMSEGHVEQTGTPEEVYNKPNCEFVAKFLGSSNIYSAEISESQGGLLNLTLLNDEQAAKSTDITIKATSDIKQDSKNVRVVLRAEHLHLSSPDNGQQSTQNPPGNDNTPVTEFNATVSAVDYQGQLARYFLNANGLTFEAINTIDGRPFRKGEAVTVRVKAKEVIVMPEGKLHNH